LPRRHFADRRRRLCAYSRYVQTPRHLIIEKLSQQNLLERWPVEEDPPERSTLSRWLKPATQQRLLCCSGSGYRGDGFRYWLPGREPLLWPGDNASEADKQAWRDRCAAYYRSLREQPASA
jgi:hypothetical protein